jgi:hypothetical protein
VPEYRRQGSSESVVVAAVEGVVFEPPDGADEVDCFADGSALSTLRADHLLELADDQLRADACSRRHCDL